MADWLLPTTESQYDDVIDEINGRLNDLSQLFNGLAPTNLPAGTIRFDGGTGVLQLWDGVAWGDLGTQYLRRDQGGTLAAPLVVDVEDDENPAFRITQRGAGHAFVVEDSTSPDATPFIINGNGASIVGHTTFLSAANQQTGTPLTFTHQQLGTSNSTAGRLFAEFNSANNAAAPAIVLARAFAADIGTFTAVPAGAKLGYLLAEGSDGTGFVRAGDLFWEAEGTISTGIVPARAALRTADSAGVLQERLIADSAGNITFKGPARSSSATGGVGYSTGAGGTVTQATSKATGVTLNKVCGQITMHAAALDAAVKVSFLVSNSAVAATDLPVVGVVSGGTANAYRASVTAVAAGSFTITVENITGGSLSEAPVIAFSLGKVVTA